MSDRDTNSEEWTTVRRARPKVKRPEPSPPRTEPAEPTIPIRKSSREKKVTSQYNPSTGTSYNMDDPNMYTIVSDVTIEHLANQCTAYFAAYGIDQKVTQPVSQKIATCLGSLDELSPYQFGQVFKAAKQNNPDILSFDQAMRDHLHIEEWLAAALKEITQLEKKNCWSECLKSEAKSKKIIPCTWVFNFKRNPAGEITKCKARICLRGDLMTDDSESYAPVVQWLSLIHI